MALDFHTVFQIPRESLENDIDRLRKGRLKKVAYEHYREKIAYYFRRYPYDEWYPLNKAELKAYIDEKSSVEPFKWQLDT